ncbi:MAG: hypothetical protein DMG39_17505 [Acidobacteria bacterium]|nr:MAG: hypothetical protein DMG39_17505 [Acidobacteriota bacterium]
MTSNKSHGAHRILLIRPAVAKVPRSRNIMRRIYTNLLSIALFLFVVPTALASTTWYVDGVNGNDSNNCQTPETACKAIGRAISLAGSGDSIIVAPAIYTENLTITFSLNLIGSGANTTILDGGGVKRVINISTGNVTLSDLTVRNGAANPGYGGIGGGIYNAGNLFISASTISGNVASALCPPSPCTGGGGGIYNSGKLTISMSTIAANTAEAGCVYSQHMPCVSTAHGGGIFNRGTMILSNSTIAANTARHIANGFAFQNVGGIVNIGNAMISNSTISGNNPNGIANNQGFSVTLQNSIVSNNAGSNCSSGMVSNGYNLSSDGTCTFNSRGDLNNHDPLLGPLQNNGGPTQTMALLPGSPAIDGGNPAGCTDGLGNLLKTDQRGMPRPDKEDTGGCDMGAYESQSD